MKPKFQYLAWDLGNGQDLYAVTFGKKKIELGISDTRDYSRQLVKAIKMAYKEGLEDAKKQVENILSPRPRR